MKSSSWFFIAIMAMLGGCATASRMQTFTIAGGETIELPIAPGGALPTENSDVKIEVTGFALDGQAKTITYAFGFTEKKRDTPRLVKVEDVTGSTAELLVEDKSPRLNADGFWNGSAMPRKKGDTGLSWLNETGDTTKVFRFTIVTADGRQLVMNQASVWSGSSKPLLRQVLDAKG